MAPASRPSPPRSTPPPSAKPRSAGEAVDPAEKKHPPSRDTSKPGAGRTGPLGRKVESPASLRTAGPSGQRNRVQEQKKHTNK